jgi:hypothetical protein
LETIQFFSRLGMIRAQSGPNGDPNLENETYLRNLLELLFKQRSLNTHPLVEHTSGHELTGLAILLAASAGDFAAHSRPGFGRSGDKKPGRSWR